VANDEWRRPDEQLAGRIADRLAGAGLILPRDVEAVREEVAAGRATRDDWLSWIGLALEEQPVWDGEADGADR
jgi:hypothetical protein